MSVILTLINFPGADWTQVNGVNRQGPLGRSVQIVGSFGDISGTHGFSYSRGQYTRFDVPDMRDTQAMGINGRGQIVGISSKIQGNTDDPPFQCSPFILDSGTYSSDIPVRQTAGSENLALYGMNDSGATVGSFIGQSGSMAQTMGYSCTSSVPHLSCAFEAPPIGSAQMYGINDKGQVVGTEWVGASGTAAQAAHGIYKNEPNGGRTNLPDVPGAADTYYRGINDDGILCGYAGFGTTPQNWRTFAFVVSPGSAFTIFGVPGARSTEARGINASNPNEADPSFQVVGSYYLPDHSGPNGYRGFMATVSVPRVVTWDGDDFVEHELAASAMVHVDCVVASAALP